MQDFEKLGVFYLGRQCDPVTHAPREDLVLYDAKDLTTHAVCVGMTGSGKTGLCLDLLEEAAIDGIPAIAIDPKGDIGNLLLTFPELRPDDFAPWIDAADATRHGQSPDDYAQTVAERWRKGLAEWGQDGARIQRLRDSVDLSIYTPGSDAGIGLTVLRSFAAPSAAVMADTELYRERMTSAAAGLLALLGIDADPLKSREQILLSTLLDQSWRAGKDLSLGDLIRGIQEPPFDRVGFLDLESYFPAKERFALAIALNNLIASPAFAAWLTGEPLDVERLLYTPAGKPRLSIISIAHLSDAERMFFVTILLNEVLTWVRQQSGTSSLRALIYMDEVFGYFPPSRNPPSKLPMLTLLKQARAFGVGVVLATQNPVDLDYKGLANCGTWFLGRLQTERDKARMLDGLEGASATSGTKFDRAQIEKMLSALEPRTFLMNNVHEDGPVILQSRWALSYLRGPLTRGQISQLMRDRRASAASPAGGPALTGAGSSDGVPGAGERPLLPPDVPETFLPVRELVPTAARIQYRPGVLAAARIQFAQATLGIDQTIDLELLSEVREITAALWDAAQRIDEGPCETEPRPEDGAGFLSLPSELARPKTYASLATSLRDHIYRSERLRVWKAPSLKESSLPGETEGEFRVRLGQRLKEQRDLAVEKLRQKYQAKIATLQEQIRKAEQKVEKQKTQATQQQWSTAMSFGQTVLGALLGRKVATSGNLSRAATAARSAGRMASEGQDVSMAMADLTTRQQQLQELETQLREEIAQLDAATHADAIVLEETAVAPKKAAISVTAVRLAWIPWIVTSDGQSTLGFRV